MTIPKENPALHGRGASWNPANRFDGHDYVADIEDAPEPNATGVPCSYLDDHTRSILSHNDSPDVGFDVSVNPYRGCEHGCIYCYARPTHEYLGYSAGLDFETKILCKRDAPQLLRKELSSTHWVPRVIAMSGVTDPYQPIERKLRLTRGCLEVLAEFRNPVGIITKNRLILRDRDLLGQLSAEQAAMVHISLTTLDLDLNRVLEPRTSSPAQRLEAIRGLTKAGIPTGILIAPVIPGLTDHELPTLLEAAAEAGARWAGYTMLRLPRAVAPLFEHWLAQHFPDRKGKVLNRIRDLRDGTLNDPEFGSRMRGHGPFAEQTRNFFRIACAKHGLNETAIELSTAAFHRPGGEQMEMF